MMGIYCLWVTEPLVLALQGNLVAGGMLATRACQSLFKLVQERVIKVGNAPCLETYRIYLIDRLLWIVHGSDIFRECVESILDVLTHSSKL